MVSARMDKGGRLVWFFLRTQLLLAMLVLVQATLQGNDGTGDALRPDEQKVRDFYEKFPFPDTAVELTRNIASVPIPRNGPWGARGFVGPSHITDMTHHVYGGHFPFATDATPVAPFRLLFAGGGTGTGMILLLNQLRAAGIFFRATHLDISEASLNVARARAEMMNYSSPELVFVRESLLASGEDLLRRLGTFDYIDCVGVLMATVDPAAALNSLRMLLRPGGGMGIMVYGSYGRAPVYQLRRAMQLLGAGGGLHRQHVAEPPRQLRMLRKVLKSSPNFWARAAKLDQHETYSDTSLADTYLHPVDRSYTVTQLFDLVRGAKLRVAGFPVVLEYDASSLFDSRQMSTMVKERARRLPWQQQLELGEELDGTLERHEFFVVHQRSLVRPPRACITPELALVPRAPTDWLRSVVGPMVGDGVLEIGATDAGHRKRTVHLNIRADRQMMRRIVGLLDPSTTTGDMWHDVLRVSGDQDLCNLFHRFFVALDEVSRALVRAGLVVITDVTRNAPPPAPLPTLAVRVWVAELRQSVKLYRNQTVSEHDLGPCVETVQQMKSYSTTAVANLVARISMGVAARAINAARDAF